MENKINEIKKSCKQMKLFLVIAMVTVLISFIINGINLITGIVHEKESYRLEMQMDKFDDKEYHLFVNEKDLGVIDKDEYDQANAESGETNYKACFMIGGIDYLIKISIVFAIVLFATRTMNDIEKDGRPFTKKNIRRLRIISALIMVFAVIPGLIKLTLTFFLFLKASMVIDTISMLVLIIGIAIAAISTVFEYGNAVQEEIDAIA